MYGVIRGGRIVPIADCKKCENCHKVKRQATLAEFTLASNLDPAVLDWRELHIAGAQWITKNKETGGFLQVINSKVQVVKAFRGARNSVKTHHSNACVLYFHVHPTYACGFPSPRDLYNTVLFAATNRVAWSVIISTTGILVYKPTTALMASVRTSNDAKNIMTSLEKILDNLHNLPYSIGAILDKFKAVGFIIHILPAPFATDNLEVLAIPANALTNRNFFT